MPVKNAFKEEAFMVRILYEEMKGQPIPLVADLFLKTIIPSIEEESLQAYQDMITPLKYKPEATEDDILESWRDVKNNLFFTKGYTDIFKDNMIDGLWIAYTSFTKIFEKYPGPDFLAPYMQVFTYKRKKFWIIKEADHVIFITPDEY